MTSNPSMDAYLVKTSLFLEEQPVEQPAPITMSPSTSAKPFTSARPIGALAPLTIPPARTVSTLPYQSVRACVRACISPAKCSVRAVADLNQLPLGKGSITHGKEAEVIDAGLFLGRSFRVGWGPGGVLFHSGSASFSRASSSLSSGSQSRPDRVQLGVVHREHVFTSSRSQGSYIFAAVTTMCAALGWEQRD
jgi:hypothetical protein